MDSKTICKNCFCVIRYDEKTVGDFVECPACNGKMPITKKPSVTVKPATAPAKSVVPAAPAKSTVPSTAPAPAPSKSVAPTTPKSTYQSLKELRSAVAALPTAEQDLKTAQYRKENAQRSLAKSKAFVAAPVPSKERKYTTKLKEEFEKEAREADRIATEKLRQKIKDKNTYSRRGLRTFLIALAVAIFAIAGTATFFVARWSWNSSLSILMEKLEASYNEAVGIHLMGLTISLLISALIYYFIVDRSDYWYELIFGVYIILGLALVSLIVSITKFTFEAEGFWETLVQIIGIIITVFISLNSTWRILAFVLCLVTTIVVTVLIFRYALSLKPKRKKGFDERRLSRYSVQKAVDALDYKQFYDSDVYKEAKQLDEEYNREQDRLNLQNHKDNIPTQTKLIETYDLEIKRYQDLIQKCKSTIQNATFLHSSYRNLACLDTIIYYFDYNRADTIKEAINQYISDQQHFAIINKLSEMERNQLNAVKSAVNAITKKLDSVSNAITSEIAEVRRATERQTSVIEAESQKLREENEKRFREAQRSADRRAEQLDGRLGSIISNQHLTQETIRNY